MDSHSEEVIEQICDKLRKSLMEDVKVDPNWAKSKAITVAKFAKCIQNGRCKMFLFESLEI